MEIHSLVGFHDISCFQWLFPTFLRHISEFSQNLFDIRTWKHVSLTARIIQIMCFYRKRAYQNLLNSL